MKRDSVKLGSIHIHPVKAGRAVALESARVEPMGLAGDRRFMLVDAAGDALTQRDLPKLARLEASLDADGLILVFDGPGEEAGERFVPTPEGDERLTVTVWASTVDAALADAATNAALSRWLATPVRLVRIDRPAARTANPAFAGEGASVSFADGYPILVVTAASLRALNRTIVNASDTAEAVPLSRFRPNLVIEGAEPWAEDGWRTIRIGDVVLDLVKPCDRCIVTTIDQATGRKDRHPASRRASPDEAVGRQAHSRRAVRLERRAPADRHGHRWS